MTDVFIIGAGPSGIMAAVSAAKGGVDVILADSNDIVGRKLLSTGNGRCNFTNQNMSLSHFRTDYEDAADSILNNFSLKDTLDFFENIGVFPYEREGYYYPYTNSAKDVRLCLERELYDYDNIRLLLSNRISKVEKRDNSFIITTNNGDIHKSRALIVATGGRAMPACGCEGFGYTIAKQIGHHILPISEALVALKCREKYFRRLKGIRVKGCIKLLIAGKPVASDFGELQLTDIGISGIPTFNVSRYATNALNYGINDVVASINLSPDITMEELSLLLEKRIFKNSRERTIKEVFIGFLDERICRVLFSLIKLDSDMKAKDISRDDFMRICDIICDWRVHITGSLGFDKAQTTAGGIALSEFDEATLMSKLCDGLFCCGEVLDVDGMCGGYNIQWALSSGYVAGKGACSYAKG